MRTQRNPNSVKVWLSASDTYNWAHRPNASWPYSTLSNHRVFAEFEANGDLVDFALDGKADDNQVDGHEFRAMIADLVPTGPITLNLS
jgi:hypothetical protein